MNNPNFLGGDDAFAASVRHRVVAEDLDRLANAGIGAIDLASCPLVDGWTISFGAPSAYLLGDLSGDPSQPAGFCRTSGLVALDIQAGWARSWSRFYRLGTCGNSGAGR